MINKHKKQIKAFLKQLKTGKQLLLTCNKSSYQIKKISENKYIVANASDLLFIGFYDEHIFTKHNLINYIMDKEGYNENN